MTPSEIAEVYGMGDLPTNGLLLEVISKQADALKIATEALDAARMESSEYLVIVPINEALARIKEV